MYDHICIFLQYYFNHCQNNNNIKTISIRNGCCSFYDDRDYYNSDKDIQIFINIIHLQNNVMNLQKNK